MPVSADDAVVAPAIVHVRSVTPQLSDTAASGTAIEAVQTPASAFADMFAGHVITGGWFSVTVTVKVHVAWFPEASATVYVTVVIPVLKA
jgi:hypothetical protein